MKLRRELIDHLAARVAKQILGEKLISGIDAATCASRVAAAVTQDLQVEDRLNEEVREILREHSIEMDRQQVEFHEMFKKVKAKLVRDRNLIL